MDDKVPLWMEMESLKSKLTQTAKPLSWGFPNSGHKAQPVFSLAQAWSGRPPAVIVYFCPLHYTPTCRETAGVNMFIFLCWEYLGVSTTSKNSFMLSLKTIGSE